MDATTGVFNAVVAAASRRAAKLVPGGSRDVSSKGEATAGSGSRAVPAESDERKNTMEDFPEAGASSGFSTAMETAPVGAYLPDGPPPAARGSPYRLVGIPVALLSRYAANGSDPASEKEPVPSKFLPGGLAARGTRTSILVSRESMKSSVEVRLD